MRAESTHQFHRSIDRSKTMAVSPSAHYQTTPNAHPVAAGRLGDGSEAADAAIEAAQLSNTAVELVCSDGMEKQHPSAAPPNPHPVTAGHLGDGAEAADVENEAFLPPDNSSDVAMTLPPSLPSPEAMAVAPKAMATIPTAFQPCGGANVTVPTFMGPSRHVEEVLLGLHHPRKNPEERNISEIECPDIGQISTLNR
jgi:hypothetical protein